MSAEHRVPLERNATDVSVGMLMYPRYETIANDRMPLADQGDFTHGIVGMWLAFGGSHWPFAHAVDSVSAAPT